ncbi:MAG: acyltransferase family protein [Bacteroidota bacterium]
MSLDVFRGITILGMLLVNNIALDTATPTQLTHASWNAGLHFADLVFPWFLFIVGVAIPYSAASARRRKVSAWRYDLKVLNRAVTLVLLGCLIDSSIALTPVFDLGVLQLIGLAYFVAAFLYELHVRRRLLIAAGLLVGYWAILRFVPVPGLGRVFTPEHNIINHINIVYLVQYHLQGLLSVIPTAALVMIGSAVGDILRNEVITTGKRLGQLFLLGGILTVAGLILSLDLPFNKPLWTTSYILYCAGLATLLLSLLYLVIDVNNWRAWAWPFAILGMNALFIYIVPILVKLYILSEWHWRIEDGSRLQLGVAIMHYWFEAFGRVAGGWAYTISYIVFWWLVAVWLWHRKIFLRL